MEVATTGTPNPMLWLIFPLTPAPYLNGATDSFTLSKYGRTSGCKGRHRVMTTVSLASATTSGGGLSPIM